MNSNTDPTAGQLPLTGQRWLIIGSAGMLGQDMVAAVDAAGAAAVVGLDRPEIDITDAAQTLEAVRGFDVVVNCAAWTAVDAAEEHEAAAFAVNAVGPANVARACAAAGARLVQISTDYVFAGDGAEPYREQDPIAPASAYGRTKAAGEWAVAANTDDHLIVRTAWLYGAGGPNFPKTMARLGAERDVLTVVCDQRGQPTWTRDLADLIVRLVAAQAPAGVYHGTSTGEATWHEFAQAVLAAKGLPTKVEPVTSAQFAAAAKAPTAARPANSALRHDALHAAGVEPIGPWEQRWAQAAPEVLADPQPQPPA